MLRGRAGRYNGGDGDDADTAGQDTARTVLGAAQWLWTAVLSLVFIVLGLALVGGGALFAIVGAQAVLTPGTAGHVIAGVLFVVLGLAAVVGGVLAIWLRPKLIRKLSGRKSPSTGGGYFGGGYAGGDGGGGGNC